MGYAKSKIVNYNKSAQKKREILPIMSVMDECIVKGRWEVCMDFFLTCICRFIHGGQ